MMAAARSGIDVELAFDRDIADAEALWDIATVLRESAPTWASELTSWMGRRRTPIGSSAEAFRDAIIAEATERGPTYRALVATYGGGFERRFGFAEVRGSVPNLILIVRIDAAPFRRIGGKLPMGNGVTVQIRRASIEGQPAYEWALGCFEALCQATSPAWDCVSDVAEFRRKVMSDPPGGRSLGWDFSRFLPGVFDANFFGEPYVRLIGEDRLLDAPAQHVRSVDAGVLVGLRESGPRTESTEADAQRVRDHLGRGFFFDKFDPPDAYVAPAWPDGGP